MEPCRHRLCELIGGDCSLATRRSRGCTPGLGPKTVAPEVFDEVRALLPRIDGGDREAAVRLAAIVRREALEDRRLLVIAVTEEPDLAPALGRLCLRQPPQRPRGSGPRTKNLWIQTEYPHAMWTADLTDIATQPRALVDVARAVLAAGEAHRIYRVIEAPEIGYLRERDGALGDVLVRMLEHDRVVDLFHFTGAAMMPGQPHSSTVETDLCYFDRDDRRVERPVRDLGAVLESVEPVPGSIARGFMTHYPAIRITGRRYTDVRERVFVDSHPHPLPVSIRIAVHSDIWWPWVFGSAHPERDHRRMFDNRDLALMHTLRLNAFLRDVAAATRSAGGTFALQADETTPTARNWTDDTSVLLDWKPPDGVMPPEALDAEWFA